MTPATTRKHKAALIERLKSMFVVNGYTETKHGKWVNADGNKRWELGANNLKLQRKVESSVISFGEGSEFGYTIPARWVNVRSTPYSTVVVIDEGPIKLKIIKGFNYGNGN